MIKHNIAKTYTDEKVKNAYFNAGYLLADALDFAIKGRTYNYKIELENFAFWEKTYANRGYKTIPLENFISLHEGKSIDHLLMQKRENEDIILYGQNYEY